MDPECQLREESSGFCFLGLLCLSASPQWKANFSRRGYFAIVVKAMEDSNPCLHVCLLSVVRPTPVAQCLYLHDQRVIGTVAKEPLVGIFEGPGNDGSVYFRDLCQIKLKRDLENDRGHQNTVQRTEFFLRVRASYLKRRRFCRRSTLYCSKPFAQTNSFSEFIFVILLDQGQLQKFAEACETKSVCLRGRGSRPSSQSKLQRKKK